MKPVLNTTLLFMVFLMGAFIFLGVRDANLRNKMLDPIASAETNQTRSQDKQRICNLPTCLRISANALSDQTQSIFEGLARGIADYDPTYFGGEGTMSFDIRLATIMSGVFVRIILLLPILIAAALLFATVWNQLAFLVLTFLSLAGWGPWVYVKWYKFIGQFIDWPKAWWDFRQPVIIYDFGVIGFVFLLLLYLCIRKRIRYWEVAALTVFGQSIFEHLGLVTGISIFAFELLRSGSAPFSRRFKRASSYLAVCGASSLLFFLGLYSALTPDAGSALASPKNTDIGLSVIDYFRGFWVVYGSVNFNAIDILAANFFSLLLPSMLAGGLLAGFMKFSGGSSERDSNQIKRRAAAGAAVVIGFLAALFVGMFISGYHSEAGRQLLPLISILIFAAAYQCYWFLVKNGAGYRPN